MGKATGIFLIFAGIGTAALVLPKVDADAEKQLADVVRIATGNAQPAQPAQTARPANEAPVPTARLKAAAAVTTLQSSVSGRVTASRVDKDVAAVPPQPALPASQPQTAPQPQREAAIIPPPVLVTPPQPVLRNAAPMRTDDVQGRVTLARDIQKELKRVGCYDGEISGEWNAATKRAMAQFINRLNAALPSDEPDHILRAMVQGYPGNACGRSTPSGIVAQSGATRPVSKPADQQPRDIAASRPTVPKPAWETSVATAAVLQPSVPKPIATEGRMAVGAPVAVSPAPAVTGSINAPELKPIAPSSGNVIAAAPLPGAIAALSGGVIPPEQGVRAAAQTDELAAAERRARQRERERRQAASEQQQPIFPQAYRLGALPQQERYTVSETNRDRRATFTQRFFERQKVGDTR